MGKQYTSEEIMQRVSSGKPFTLLFLKGGKQLPPEENAVNALQMGHLGHLFTLEDAGKISVFGPVMNHASLRGVIVCNTTDKDIIQEWMADDPYIKEGYLTYELYDWFTIPGMQIPK